MRIYTYNGIDYYNWNSCKKNFPNVSFPILDDLTEEVLNKFGITMREVELEDMNFIGKKFYKQNYDFQEYSACAEWCNKNNATIVDKGDYYECVAIPQPSNEEKLASAKAKRIQELKLARDAEELSPISYGGYLWDFDDKAQMRINGAITVLGTATVTWTSADNEEVENVGVNELKSVVGAAALRSNELHVKYRELKAQVDNAETVEEVEAIAW